MRLLALVALWITALVLKTIQSNHRSDLLDESLVAPFTEYAKERFLSIEAQIKDCRNSARQLASALTVVIGLELTALFKIVSDYIYSIGGWHSTGLFLMLTAFITQVVSLFFVIHDGFTTTNVLGPEAPTVLRYHLSAMPVDAARETFANYYANSCDRYFELQTVLGKRVRRSAHLLIISLLLFVVGVVGIVRFDGVNKKQPSSQLNLPLPSSSRTQQPGGAPHP
jgi:hypothetical protein